MLPLSFVVNATFPYEEKLEAARRYLRLRGITDPRPIRKGSAPGEAYEGGLVRTRARVRIVPKPVAH